MVRRPRGQAQRSRDAASIPTLYVWVGWIKSLAPRERSAEARATPPGRAPTPTPRQTPETRDDAQGETGALFNEISASKSLLDYAGTQSTTSTARL